MTDMVFRLRGTALDKDNMPRMDSEKWFPVGLAKEAADEIERLRNSRDYWKGKAERMRDAVEYAHSEGFEWPSDPLAEDAPLTT